MVSFVVRLKFAPQHRDEVAESLRLLTAESRKEPGCMTYVPHQLQDDPDTILIYEQYRDDAAFAAHRESAHFKTRFEAVLSPKILDRNLEFLTALV